jgi:hypothetical protein
MKRRSAMKKALFPAVVILVSVTFMSLAIAQDRTAPMMEKDAKAGMMNKQAMMGQERMTGMHDMYGTMMGSMMGRSMVASEDGGVIIMMGDKLMKYDKDLNLVKEIQVEIDMDHMNALMTKMMSMYPMRTNMQQGGMMQGGMMQGNATQKEETNTKK